MSQANRNLGRSLAIQAVAMLILLAGAFLVVLGASVARAVLMVIGLAVVLAAAALLAWSVLARNKGLPPGEESP